MRRTCPKCGSTSVVMFNADEDWCTQCKERFPGISYIPDASTEITALRTANAALTAERDEMLKEMERLRTAMAQATDRLRALSGNETREVTCSLGLDSHEDCRDTPCNSCTAHDETREVCEWGYRDGTRYGTSCGCSAIWTSGPYCQHCGKIVTFNAAK